MFVPIVLTTLLEHPCKQYIVYTDHEGMHKLFNELNLSNCITLKYATQCWSRNPYKMYKIKRNAKNQLKDYKIDSITFYHTEHGELANYIISLYSSKIPIYFEPPYKRWIINKKKTIKSIYLKFKYKFFFNTDIVVQTIGEFYIPTMTDYFYKKNNVQKRTSKINNKLIANCMSSKYNIFHNKNNILLLNGAIKALGVDTNKYRDIIDKIINYVGKDNIYTKCHPRYNDLYGMEKEITEIPSYIPANLLLEQFHIYIGYISTALVEAAIAGKKAISLLFIISQSQEEFVKSQCKILEEKLNGKGIIYYPQSIEDLIQYLKA